jgi:3-oxoacyl-[acyl-carrier protein] reductase
MDRQRFELEEFQVPDPMGLSLHGFDLAAEEVVVQVVEAGARAIAVGADVSESDAVARLFDETERAFEPIDAVVDNAGIMITKPI